jgi:hypothetical protein
MQMMPPTRKGRSKRGVPLFPELRPFLDEAYQMASEGSSWVVPILEGKGTKNLGTTFRKIIRRACLPTRFITR